MRASMLFAVALLVPGIVDAQIHIRPGYYEFTFDMDLGLPEEAAGAVLKEGGLKDFKKLECLTDDIKDANDIAKRFAEPEGMPTCRISNLETAGNKVTYTMTCQEDDVRMTMHTEMTFGTDSFTTVTKGTDPEGRPTRARMTARRVGECPK